MTDKESSTTILRLAVNYGSAIDDLVQCGMTNLILTAQRLHPIDSSRLHFPGPVLALMELLNAIFSFLEASYRHAECSISLLSRWFETKEVLSDAECQNYQDRMKRMQSVVEDLIHKYEIICGADRDVIARCLETASFSFQHLNSDEKSELGLFNEYLNWTLSLPRMKKQLIVLENLNSSDWSRFGKSLSLNPEVLHDTICEYEGQIARIGVYGLEFKRVGLNSPTSLNHRLLDIINRPSIETAIMNKYQRRIKITLKYLRCNKLTSVPALLLGPSMLPLTKYFGTQPFMRSLVPRPLRNFMTSYAKMLGHFYDAFTLVMTTELHIARLRTRDSGYFLQCFASAILPIEEFQESAGRHMSDAMAEMGVVRSLAINLLKTYTGHLDASWLHAFLCLLRAAGPHVNHFKCTHSLLSNLMEYADQLEKVFTDSTLWTCTHAPCCDEELKTAPNHAHSPSEVIKELFCRSSWKNTHGLLATVHAGMPVKPRLNQTQDVAASGNEMESFPPLNTLHSLHSELSLVLSVYCNPVGQGDSRYRKPLPHIQFFNEIRPPRAHLSSAYAHHLSLTRYAWKSCQFLDQREEELSQDHGRYIIGDQI